MDELARRLAVAPGSFPHAIDAARDLLLLVELSEAEINAASFLDQRVLTPRTAGRWLPFAEIEERIDPAMRDDAHYIFHIGHVGSTLLARLLGEIDGARALREPLVLRDLADLHARRDDVDAPWEPASLARRTRMIRSLLAHTVRPDQRAIVKATSFTSEIAPALVSQEAHALLLYASPESYMTTILAGENSRRELAAATMSRLPRLARRIAPMTDRLWSLGEGERIALGWKTEMLSLQATAEALGPKRTLWLDFDEFLARPVEMLVIVAAHFGLILSETEAATLIAGPIMQHYSKAPEHGYSADLRRRLQRQAAVDHRDSLRQGLGWLDRHPHEHGAIDRARSPASSVRSNATD